MHRTSWRGCYVRSCSSQLFGGAATFPNRISVKLSLALLSFGLSVPAVILAGPFLATGNSTVHSVDALYRKSTKTSSDQLTQTSEITAEQSAASSRSTYQYSTQPTAELSSEVSEASSEVTAQSSDYTTEASEQSTEATKPLTKATYEHSTKPTAELTTKASEASVDASEASSEVTAQSSDYTTEASEQSTEATAPLTRATYEQSTKPTAELTTQGSRASSDVSAETSAYTPRVAQSTGDASTGAVRNSGDGALKVSATLDASLANTTRLTWKKYEATLLDPDVADELIRNAHTFSGPTLRFFADELAVSSEHLASVIVQHVPKQATRSQLQRLMSYVIPHLVVVGQT